MPHQGKSLHAVIGFSIRIVGSGRLDCSPHIPFTQGIKTVGALRQHGDQKASIYSPFPFSLGVTLPGSFAPVRGKA